MSVTYLLGPQRFLTTAGAVVRSLDTEGPVATIAAGWEEREVDDGELDEVLDGRSRNLHLFGRLLDVLERDPVLAAAVTRLNEDMLELAGTYVTRLGFALEAVYAMRQRSGRRDIVDDAVEDAIGTQRQIDTWYLGRLGRLKSELVASGALERSELLTQHRGEVAEQLAGCSVLAVAGGHVAMLLRCLQLFDVQVPRELPVVAWSAGAMAMTSRVVLFHDTRPNAFTGAEVWDRGLHRTPQLVAFPHARRRLRLDDAFRVQVLARRFERWTCLLLDDGAKVAVGPDGALPDGARIITTDGTIRTVGAPA